MIQLIYTLIVTHITIVCVTLYLHRAQAHRAVKFHPIVEHFMRFWLWLTTGMVTSQWVAIHRKHHQCTDVAGDPHSPHQVGLSRVLWGGAWLYHTASKDRDMIDQLSLGTPNDAVEQKLYSRYSRWGIVLMLLINLTLFGAWGILTWLVQLAWIPFWAAGVVNGIGHWWGYRNGDTRDESRNILPWGIIIGGEELHNNHHMNSTSARLSRHWWEFDIGWMYITVLRHLGLAQLRSQGQ